MTDKPPRYKSRAQLTMDEELAVVQAQHRGEPLPRFETDEYRRARRDALEAAGLEPEDNDAEPTALEDMTTEDHVNRIRRTR